jgi:phospholipid/cholesterol/gamma-HCH transport system substrate-binding protein
MEERFKFRHVNAITGTFVLVVAAVLVAALVFAGRSQRWFIRNVTLRIILPKEGAAGIRQGSEVYFLGTLMGTVSDVIADAAGRMEARANIRRDFFLFVRADSSAVVKKKFGVAGDSYFEVTRGEGQPLPEKNASIVCKEQLPNAIEAPSRKSALKPCLRSRN